MDLPARSFDLVRPGVVPPLHMMRGGGVGELTDIKRALVISVTGMCE